MTYKIDIDPFCPQTIEAHISIIYTPFLSIDKYRHNVSFSPSPTVSKFADDAPLPSPTVGDMTPIEIRLQTEACPLSHP